MPSRPTPPIRRRPSPPKRVRQGRASFPFRSLRNECRKGRLRRSRPPHNTGDCGIRRFRGPAPRSEADGAAHSPPTTTSPPGQRLSVRRRSSEGPEAEKARNRTGVRKHIRQRTPTTEPSRATPAPAFASAECNNAEWRPTERRVCRIPETTTHNSAPHSCRSHRPLRPEKRRSRSSPERSGHTGCESNPWLRETHRSISKVAYAPFIKS